MAWLFAHYSLRCLKYSIVNSLKKENSLLTKRKLGIMYVRIFTEASYSYNLSILVPYGALYKNKIYNIIKTIAGTVVGIIMYVIQMLEEDYYSEEMEFLNGHSSFLYIIYLSAGLHCCKKIKKRFGFKQQSKSDCRVFNMCWLG